MRLFCPDENSEPSITEFEKDGFWVQSSAVEEPYRYTFEMMCPLKVRHMYINEEGFVITKRNWSAN
jgi:hypothetical protein